jgi:hypothetical protein
MEKSDSVAGEREDPFSESRLSFRDLVKVAGTQPETSAEKPKPESPIEEQQNSIESDQIVYELTDIVEEPYPRGLTVSEFNMEIMKKVTEITEKIAKDMIPDIVERVIREEIEKLKAGEPPTDNDV